MEKEMTLRKLNKHTTWKADNEDLCYTITLVNGLALIHGQHGKDSTTDNIGYSVDLDTEIFNVHWSDTDQSGKTNGAKSNDYTAILKFVNEETIKNTADGQPYGNMKLQN